MGVHMLPFIAVSVVIVITPGPDTLTVRAALDAVSGVVLVAVGVRLALERW